MQKITVVVPVGHSWEITKMIIRSPVLDGAEIVIVTDCEDAYESLASMTGRHNEKTVLVLRNSGAGAGDARNCGLRHASRELIWFLDSDCVPTVFDEKRLQACLQDGDVVALGGTTHHRSTHRHIDVFLSRCELTSEYAVGQDHDALWAPSCNLLVRRNALQPPDSNPFPSYYPRRGGGEDVHLCLELTAQGRLVRTTAMAVKHPEWPPIHSLLSKFSRWGWAEGLLTLRANRFHGVIPHQLSPAFYTAVGLICLFLPIAIVYADAALASFAAVLVTVVTSILLEITIGVRRFRSILHSALNTVVLYVFELCGIACRLWHGRPDALFVELRYFVDQKAFRGVDGVRLVVPLGLGSIAAMVLWP